MIANLIIVGVLVVYILLVTNAFISEIFLISLIFFVLAYGVYLGLTIYFHKKKKKVEPVQSKPIEQKEIKPEWSKERVELKDFVKYNVHYGQKEPTVRQALEKQGWPKEKIEKAFIDYNSEK
tara:strand:- start:109 stop:474 length:366 start_codon:yes stop_codon:yes gene_type:complete